MLISALAILLPWDEGFIYQSWVRWFLTLAYLAVLFLVSVYGAHRYWLVWLYYRNRRHIPRPPARFAELPRVTVQLPMYNEARVAARVIDAACRIEYPRERLQIQVLDDSTDESVEIARQRVEYWQREGLDIQYVRRDNRHGYKAGALAAALPQATGEFIAIFDADFVPRADFLRKTIHHFTDPKIGMVQACWGHINRDNSLLTRAQAVFLDGHFIIEHTARNRSGRWMNFNGTAGMWRRAAIESAGGWQHDTLTEDVDLSYRAQLAGWRFVYLQRLSCPAELPPEINAFKSQQHRWTKGSIQTAKKLLPRLLMAKAPLGVKVEAFFHLTSPMVYLYVTLMALLFYPALFVNITGVERGSWGGLLMGLSLFALGTVSASAFYVASQRIQHRSGWGTVALLPVLMSVGIGIALNNARGCIEALLGHESPFVRTPKYNVAARGQAAAARPAETAPHRTRIIATPSIKLWMSLLEIGMGLYMIACVQRSLEINATLVSTPFLFLFAAGYLYVGIFSLWSQSQAWRARRAAAAV